MAARHFKNQLLLAFLFFSSALGVAFYQAIDYGIHETEDYILRGYLLGTVEHALSQPVPAIPDQYAISSRLVAKNDLPVELNGRTEMTYQPGGNHSFSYIRPWPGESGRYLITTIDETIVSDFEEKETYIKGFMLLVVVIIVLLSWLLALWLANIIARPLLQLTQVIDQTPIDAQISVPQTLYGEDRKDEIGHLSRAFSTLLQRVRSALQQERAFSHHVSHELRTPLSLISNATALLKKQVGYDDPGIMNNVRRIESATQRIDARIRLFLYLGLEQQPKQTVYLQTIWQNTVTYIRQQVADPVSFQRQVVADDSLEATPSLMQALLENSLLNAMQYGMDIDVELDGSYYCIRNTVSDIAPVEGSRFGYGLSIIQRVCEASDWHLEIRQENRQFQLLVRFV